MIGIRWNLPLTMVAAKFERVCEVKMKSKLCNMLIKTTMKLISELKWRVVTAINEDVAGV